MSTDRKEIVVDANVFQTKHIDPDGNELFFQSRTRGYIAFMWIDL